MGCGTEALLQQSGDWTAAINADLQGTGWRLTQDSYGHWHLQRPGWLVAAPMNLEPTEEARTTIMRLVGFLAAS